MIQPVPPQIQVTQKGFKPLTEGVTATGWQVAQDGITEVLPRVRDGFTALPRFVAETGAAHNYYFEPDGQIKDPERIAVLDPYIRPVHAVIARRRCAWADRLVLPGQLCLERRLLQALRLGVD